MNVSQELSEKKRALLERYLSGSASIKHLYSNAMSQVVAPKTDSRTEITFIQGKGTERPFFFLHGDWTENAFFCFSLARDLGNDQPFYTLEPYRFEGLSTPPSTERIAAAHITSMRAYQAEGPYRLGGFCNGGLIAYEMARQLHEQGQETELLVLIDPIPARRAAVCNALRRLGRLVHASKEQELHWFLRLRHIYKFAQFSAKQRREDRKELRRINPELEKISASTHLLRQDYPGMFTWATANYVPSYYAGKVTLFWEEGEPFRKAQWNKMAVGKDAQVEEHIIRGNHFTCRTDHLSDMAEQLRACLNCL